MAAEEVLDLQDEIIAIQQLDKYLNVLANNKIPYLDNLTIHLAGALKSWLFTYYTAVHNFKSYDEINNRSLKYKNRVIHNSSINDLVLRDRFQQIDTNYSLDFKH